MDFSPVYRCMHIYTVLREGDTFKAYYRQQRKQQARLVLQSPINMVNILNIQKVYLWSSVSNIPSISLARKYNWLSDLPARHRGFLCSRRPYLKHRQWFSHTILFRRAVVYGIIHDSECIAHSLCKS